MHLPLSFKKILVFLGDLILFFISLIITLSLRFGKNLSLDTLREHLYPFLILLAPWMFFLFVLGGYNLSNFQRKKSIFLRISIFGILTAISAAIFFYLLPRFNISPKTNLAIFCIIFAALLYFWRNLITKIFSSYLKQRFLVFGENADAKILISYLRQSPQLGWEFVGSINEKDAGNITRIVKEKNPDVIIIARQISASPKLKEIFYNLLGRKISFIALEDAYELFFRRIPVNFIDQIWFLENLQEGKKEFYDKTKRVFDILFAVFFFIISSPLWIIIPLLIKLDDRGPVFYLQKRMGKDLKTFTIFKFRTMQNTIIRKNPPWTKGQNDQRITRFGKILRLLHFDEIPQMINIVRGDISFVGPRPESLDTIKFLEKNIPHYQLRHIIKPGFIGWATINIACLAENGNIENIEQKIRFDKKKVEYDFYYIKKRSIFLDLETILKMFMVYLKPRF